VRLRAKVYDNWAKAYTLVSATTVIFIRSQY